MVKNATCAIVLVLLAISVPSLLAASDESSSPCLEWICPSRDGTHFVFKQSGRQIQLWGVNYDHDGEGRLLEDYWEEEWDRVVDDFHEIKALRANVVRIHLQVGRFLDAPEIPNKASLRRLAKLVALAEQIGLYLDVTGLGCYHKQDVPAWYDELGEQARWNAQALFWRAVADVCKSSPAVFCYDLMNEPILPGKKAESEWLAGELGGKYFVQRLSLDLAGRTREQVAREWVKQMVSAIRGVDDQHMVTVGVIPWALTFKGAKPLVIEEMFPLRCGVEAMEEFIKKSRDHADGWISFYWGRTIEENKQKGDLTGALVAHWLEAFRAMSPIVE